MGMATRACFVTDAEESAVGEKVRESNLGTRPRQYEPTAAHLQVADPVPAVRRGKKCLEVVPVKQPRDSQSTAEKTASPKRRLGGYIKQPPSEMACGGARGLTSKNWC